MRAQMILHAQTTPYVIDFINILLTEVGRWVNYMHIRTISMHTLPDTDKQKGPSL